MTAESNFANRTSEIADFQRLMAHDHTEKRVLIYRTSKSSGNSAFLKRLMLLIQRRDIAIYSDFWTEGVSDLTNAFMDERQRRLVCRLGDFLSPAGPVGGLLSKLAVMAVGSASMPLTFGATALAGIGQGILIPQYPSYPAQRVSRAATTWPRKKIIFCIDNAQRKPRELLNFMDTFAASKAYGHVRFVLAYSDAEESMPFAEFRRRLRFPPDSVIDAPFAPLDADFVAALASTRGKNLDHDQCQDIVRRAQDNIWNMVDILDGTDQEPAAEKAPLSSLSIFVLRILLVAQQPLRRTDLRSIGLRSQLIIDETLSALDGDLNGLVERLLVQRTSLDDGDQLINLVTRTARPVASLADDVADNFVARRELYDYFRDVESISSTRHSVASSAALLYRLARSLDPASVPRLAQKLVEVAMGQGSLEDAKRYIDLAKPTDTVPILHDQFVQIAFFVSVQEYKRAKDILDVIPRAEFTRYRVLRILDAVALNRLRSHGDSDRQIDKLLSEEASDEERCLLVSYKLSGLLHEAKHDAAREVFATWSARLRGTRNYPYLLRNAAAVYMWGRGKDLPKAEALLNDAIGSFSRTVDSFGVATARCNLGVVKAYRGDLAAAETLFRKSFEALSVLGTQHVEESGTNLATALLLRGRDDVARGHLTKLVSIMEMDFPRTIAECTMAILELQSERHEAARDRMRKLVSVVDDVAMPEASRRVRLTAALVEAAVDSPPGLVDALIRDAELYGGPGTDILRLRQAIDNGVNAETARSYYPYEFLQYWSQNPLKMLPVETLTPDAVFDDVA